MPVSQGSDPWIVDADGHVREPDRLYTEFLDPAFAHLRPREEHRDGRTRWVLGDTAGAWRTSRVGRYDTGGPASKPVPTLNGEWDPVLRLQDMHTDRISHAVLFPTEAMAFAAVPDRAGALALSRAYNDWLGEYCAADPDHLLHVAHVPFGNTDDAVAELRRARESYGSVAVYLRPNPYPPGRFLSDPGHEPFWAAAEELGVTVCLHEACLLTVPTPGLDRFGPEDFMLVHAAAHPIGMMMAILEVIGTGVLERHPDLRVGFLEAGSDWLPAWLDRFDEHAEEFAGGERFSMSPSERFRRQCFVSTEGGEALTDVVMGQYPDNVVFASDYPHADCTFPGAPLEVLEDERLDDQQKRRILVDNPARWFALTPALESA